jgi:hypothetical protein
VQQNINGHDEDTHMHRSQIKQGTEDGIKEMVKISQLEKKAKRLGGNAIKKHLEVKCV